jgi:hypothetical protein
MQIVERLVFQTHPAWWRCRTDVTKRGKAQYFNPFRRNAITVGASPTSGSGAGHPKATSMSAPAADASFFTMALLARQRRPEFPVHSGYFFRGVQPFQFS